MKTPHPIDDLFRSQLHDLEMAAPLHLWEKMEPHIHLPSPASRKRSFIRAGLLALSISILTTTDTPSLSESVQNTYPIPAVPSPDASALPPQTPIASVESPAPTPQPKRQGITPTSHRIKRIKAAIKNPSLLPSTENSALSAPIATESGQTASPARPTIAEASTLPMRNTPFEPYPIQDFMPGIRFLGERWFASLDAAYSQEWAHRSLLPNDPSYQSYADIRNSSERFHSAHSAALRLSLIAASGLTLKSGIQVSTITEVFSQSRSEEKIILTPIKDPAGQITGTDTTIQVQEFRWDSRNQLYTIDIPILIGYEFSKGQLNIGLTAGPLLNMAFNQKGSFTSPDGKNVLNFSSNQPDSYPAFKNRLGMGWYSSVQLSYPITPSIRVLAEPYLRAFPHDYANYDYPLEQRYWSGGIFIGVRKLLGPYWMSLKP